MQRDGEGQNQKLKAGELRFLCVETRRVGSDRKIRRVARSPIFRAAHGKCHGWSFRVESVERNSGEAWA